MPVLKQREKNAPPPEEKEMSVRQRMLYNRSGVNAKKAILGTQVSADTADAPKPKVKKQPSNFSNPTDFYSGPQGEGKVTGGVRRYEGAEDDTVGYMLSDKFMESTDGCEAKKKNLGNKDSIDNKCYPVKPEEPVPCGVKIIKTREPMDAPWYEGNNPKPPRQGDEDHASGKRVFPNTHDTSFIFPPQRLQKPTNGNRKNHSHDVTNLARYSPEQLDEAPEIHGHFGPVKWHAPEMDYPIRKPTIKKVNNSATACHDVLGTERFGRAAEAPKTGVAKTAFSPKETHNMIPFPNPPQQETRPVKQDKMFRYFDPNHDDPSKFVDENKVSSKAHRGKGSNAESGSHWMPKGGKGKGMYARNSKANTVPLA